MDMRSPTPLTFSRPDSGGTAKLDKDDFVGLRGVLEIQAAAGRSAKLVGLEMVERGIGRDGYPVFSLDGERLGEITERIAWTVFEEEYCHGLCAGGVRARWTPKWPWRFAVRVVKARVVPLPFYKRAKKST